MRWAPCSPARGWRRVADAERRRCLVERAGPSDARAPLEQADEAHEKTSCWAGLPGCGCVHRTGHHRHREQGRRRLRDDPALGGPLLGGHHRHPAGHGGAGGARRPPRVRRGDTRQPHEPEGPGRGARPHRDYDPDRERGLPDRQPARRGARRQPAHRAAAGVSGGDHRRAGGRRADDGNLQDDPKRAGRPRGAHERGVLSGRRVDRAEREPAAVRVAGPACAAGSTAHRAGPDRYDCRPLQPVPPCEWHARALAGRGAKRREHPGEPA